MTRLGFQVLNAGPLATPDRALEVARRAEALGYDSIVVTDHIVIPRTTRSRYPYNETGRLFVPPDADYLEPLALLSFLAGATQRIRFAPSVLVLPYRNPVLTAKMLATLDVLSGGRLFVGVGAGWLEEEFVAMHAPPFELRGAVTDEWIELFIKLWTEDNPRFDGRFYRVGDVGFFPKPVQKPHPPIQVGGNSRPSIRRAARYGQSWHALGVPVEELPPLLDYLREQLRERPSRAGVRPQRSVRPADRRARRRRDAPRSRGARPGVRRHGGAGRRAAEATPRAAAGRRDLPLPDRLPRRGAGDPGTARERRLASVSALTRRRAAPLRVRVPSARP